MTMLSDITLVPYKNILTASIHLMTKAKSHFDTQNTNTIALPHLQLVDDMLPLAFQISSICHHSIGAAKAVLSGNAYITAPLEEMDFNGLINELENALTELNQISANDINARSEQMVIFHYPNKEMTFTCENYITSFSTPNLYFHQTTLYNLLRKEGVPFGKIDFLGHLLIEPS